jgi:ATP-dependent Clp protease, protease subunit
MKKFNSKHLNNAIIDAQRLHLEYAFCDHVDFKRRQICISNDIDDDSFAFINAAITELENNSEDPITLIINSFGGSYYDALGIIGRMQKSSCHIYTEGYGKIMSAAFIILAAGKKRYVSSYAWGMFHTLSTSHRMGPAHYFKAEAKQIDHEVKQLCKILAKFSKKSAKFWYRLSSKPDTYLTAEEMLKYGIVDEII